MYINIEKNRLKKCHSIEKLITKIKILDEMTDGVSSYADFGKKVMEICNDYDINSKLNFKEFIAEILGNDEIETVSYAEYETLIRAKLTYEFIIKHDKITTRIGGTDWKDFGIAVKSIINCCFKDI